jgi:hypothetical protein
VHAPRSRRFGWCVGEILHFLQILRAVFGDNISKLYLQSKKREFFFLGATSWQRRERAAVVTGCRSPQSCSCNYGFTRSNML